MVTHRLYHPSGHYINSKGERFDLCVLPENLVDNDTYLRHLLAREPDCTTCYDYVYEQRDEKIVIGFSSRSVIVGLG